VQLHPDVSDAESRAERRELAELYLPVAAPPDLMKLKVAAALEPRRRTSKRQKDLADIQRLIEAFPDLRDDVPPEIADRLLP
jgi:hypothetical protein